MERHDGRLTGWKEIASYLRKDVRTVLRWERERGLPVHRPPGRRGQSVYAIPEELDRWIRSPSDEVPQPATEEPRKVPRPHRVTYWLAVPAALLIAVTAYGARPRNSLAAVAVKDRAVHAYDDRGREVWVYPLDAYVVAPSVENGVGRASYVGDVDGDSSPEAVVSVVLTTQAPDAARALVLCFEADGTLKWVQELDDVLEMRGRRFRAPWAGADLLVTAGAPRRIILTAHHYTWSPALVVSIDGASGRRLSRYEHDGWIMRIDVTGDARHVIAAGIAKYDEHAIAILNADDLSEHAYFTLARPDASAAAGEPLDRQYYAISQLGTPAIHFGHARAIDPTPETIVELSPDFRRASVTHSDGYWGWHRVLEGQGRLTHGVNDCPDRVTGGASPGDPQATAR